MGKKLQKYLDEAEKTEQQIVELEERLRTIRAAQKKEEDSEIIRAIRSTKMGGRELLALLDNLPTIWRLRLRLKTRKKSIA